MKSTFFSKEKFFFLLFFVLAPLVLFFIGFVLNYFDNLISTASTEEIATTNVIEKKIYKELNAFLKILDSKNTLLINNKSETVLSTHSKKLFDELRFLNNNIKSLSIYDEKGIRLIAVNDNNWLSQNSYRSDMLIKKSLPRYFKNTIVISALKQNNNTAYISLYIPVNDNSQQYLTIDYDISYFLSQLLPYSSNKHYVLFDNNLNPIQYNQNNSNFVFTKIDSAAQAIKTSNDNFFILSDSVFSLKLGVYNSIDSFNFGVLSVINLNSIIIQLILDTLIPVFLFILLYIILGIIFMERIFNVPGVLSHKWSTLKLNLSSMMVCFTNIRHLKLQVQQYQYSHDRFIENDNSLFTGAIIYENTSDGILITDANHKIVSVNDSFSRITGYSKNEVMGKSPSFLKSGRHNKKFYQSLWTSIQNTGSWQGEVWNKRKNGEIFPELLTINTIKDSHGNITHHMGVFSDISSVSVKDEHFKHLALHDSLTNLPNRLSLKERLNQEILCSKNHERSLAVLFVDLDGFKQINDTYGHDFGDNLLNMVASRLNNCKRKNDFLARLGGDEFVYIINAVSDKQIIAHISENIIESMKTPFHVEHERVTISASIGISIYPEHSLDVQTLMKQADEAMYKAKANGRNTYVIFNAEQPSASRLQ